MTTKVTIFYCSACPQRSTRKWNLQVHIERRHPGGAEVLKGGQQAHKYSDRAVYTDAVYSAGGQESHSVWRLLRQHEEKIEELTKRCKVLERDGERQALDDYLRATELDLMRDRNLNAGNGAESLITQMSGLISAGVVIPVLAVKQTKRMLENDMREKLKQQQESRHSQLRKKSNQARSSYWAA